MTYDITLITTNKDGRSPERENIVLTSDSPLTSAQVKEQAFAACEFDTEKYQKGSEELWTSSNIQREYAALPDETILSERVHNCLLYYLTIKKK